MKVYTLFGMVLLKSNSVMMKTKDKRTCKNDQWVKHYADEGCNNVFVRLAPKSFWTKKTQATFNNGYNFDIMHKIIVNNNNKNSNSWQFTWLYTILFHRALLGPVSKSRGNKIEIARGVVCIHGTVGISQFHSNQIHRTNRLFPQF